MTPAPASPLKAGRAPAVEVRGKPAKREHTLEARMRMRKIPAISIAVFDHYEVV